jgi:hypothetical protein
VTAAVATVVQPIQMVRLVRSIEAVAVEDLVIRTPEIKQAVQVDPELSF